ALRVDKRAGRHVLLIADGHALLHGAAELEEALAQLVGRQLVDGAQTAVAQVIDVIDLADARAKREDVADGVEEVRGAERHLALGDVLVELAVDAKTAYLAEAISVGVLELFLEEFLRLFQ